MVLAVKLLVGIATAFATLVFGNLFWLHSQRTRGIRKLLADAAALERFIPDKLLREPPPQVEAYLRPMPGGFGTNMITFIISDRRTERLGRLSMAAVVAGLLAVSLLVSPVSLVINVLVLAALAFDRLAFDRIGTTAGGNAVLFLQVVAAILFRWKTAHADQCEAWLRGVPGFRLLSEHVARAARAESASGPDNNQMQQTSGAAQTADAARS